MKNDDAKSQGAVKMLYLDNDVVQQSPGHFVLCAQTDRKIPLEALRYWCVDLQEAYINAEAYLARKRALGDL